MELFPAVIIGGPPDSGKSNLTYQLSQALRRRGVQHYVLRAAPDGEGDWTNEADQALVRTILAPQTWTREFVAYICQSLDQRHLPLLVDVGGRPSSWQEVIFDHCSHAVLLTPDAASRAAWQALAARHNLFLVADLHSVLHGEQAVQTTSPALIGTLSGLTRGRQGSGPVFMALVERLATLFDYDPAQLRRYHLTSAPVETTVDLERLARSLNIPFEDQQAVWPPDALTALLNYLPRSRPLGLYGRGPNWLYAAVALHTHPAPFYQFDVRLGWVTPPQLTLGLPAAGTELQCRQQAHPDFLDLTFVFSGAHIAYEEAQALVIPPVLAEQGVALGGKLPLWLITALVLAYHKAPLIAVYQPQAGRVVVSSRVPHLAPGEILIPAA